MDRTIKSYGKFFDLTIVLLAILFIPLCSKLFTNFVYPQVASFDPDETFLWISIHHLIQLGLTIILMFWAYPKSLAYWGFNLENLSRTIKYSLLFLLIFGVLETYRLSGQESFNLEYRLTSTNKLGVQFFQYLLSGLGEEPLFRGFIMTFLATQWKTIFKPFGIELPITVLFATFFFMIAHFDIDLINFTISGFDFDQQMKALQLGLLYGIIFHYTKSLWAPIIIHGLSNGLQYSLMYYFL